MVLQRVDIWWIFRRMASTLRLHLSQFTLGLGDSGELVVGECFAVGVRRRLWLDRVGCPLGFVGLGVGLVSDSELLGVGCSVSLFCWDRFGGVGVFASWVGVSGEDVFCSGVLSCAGV